jgi:hypothetical protein
MVGMKKSRKVPLEVRKPTRGRGRPKMEGRVKVSVTMPLELKAKFKRIIVVRRNAHLKGLILNDLWVEALTSWWKEHGEKKLAKCREKVRLRSLSSEG